MGLVAFVSMSLAPFAVPDLFLNARRFAFAWNPCVLWVRVNAVVDASAAVPVGGSWVSGERGADPCCTGTGERGADPCWAGWATTPVVRRLDGLTREVRGFFFIN